MYHREPENFTMRMKLISQPQNMNADLLAALTNALEWIDAVPSDMPLPAMPGFDRDEVNALIAKAKGSM